jgi:hypothetical protein
MVSSIVLPGLIDKYKPDPSHALYEAYELYKKAIWDNTSTLSALSYFGRPVGLGFEKTFPPTAFPSARLFADQAEKIVGALKAKSYLDNTEVSRAIDFLWGSFCCFTQTYVGTQFKFLKKPAKLFKVLEHYTFACNPVSVSIASATSFWEPYQSLIKEFHAKTLLVQRPSYV